MTLRPMTAKPTCREELPTIGQSVDVSFKVGGQFFWYTGDVIRRRLRTERSEPKFRVCFNTDGTREWVGPAHDWRPAQPALAPPSAPAPAGMGAMASIMAQPVTQLGREAGKSAAPGDGDSETGPRRSRRPVRRPVQWADKAKRIEEFPLDI